MGGKVLVACLLVAVILLTDASPIKHVIVLMEENRSFDHMLGWFPGANGLKGDECNYVDATNTKSKKVCVNKVSPLVAPCDPEHSTPSTSFKIFGPTAVNKSDFTHPTMSGFVEWEDRRGNSDTNYCDVMSMLTPAHVPIISTLASEFLLFDRFFCAHPGPTWPNRMFMLSATSAGCTETSAWYHDKPGQLFPQQTIFDQLDQEGLMWKNYFNDTPWELFLTSLAHNPENLVTVEQLWEDAATGNLPAFAWINPRSGFNISLNQGSNDQHPDHDVALGEAFMKDVYEALRASPQWNETLLIITYDEHGGFYDHVGTPVTDVPPPGDGEASYPDKDFPFNRLGIRIPTLLISPWIPKGSILSGPPDAQKPAPTSEYTLTSIIATARKLLGMKSPALTKRDAWSATFEQVFNLTTPRTDCPMHLPPPPTPAVNYNPNAERRMPVNDLQKHIITAHANALGEELPTHIKEQGQVSEWLQTAFNTHKERTIAWKRSKHNVKEAESMFLVLRAPQGTVFITSSWELNKDKSPYITISTRNSTLCLDYGTAGAGVQVSVSNCYPSAVPAKNRDVSQQWVFLDDATVRPYAHSDLCLSSNILEGSEKVTLKECSAAGGEKYWAWHASAGGDNDYGDGGIVFSNWTLGLVNSSYVDPNM